MIGEIVQKLLKKNDAPEWFCADIKKRTPESEIKAKIRNAIIVEIAQRGYNKELWDDEMVSSMTVLYFRFFEQLYTQSV